MADDFDPDRGTFSNGPLPETLSLEKLLEVVAATYAKPLLPKRVEVTEERLRELRELLPAVSPTLIVPNYAGIQLVVPVEHRMELRYTEPPPSPSTFEQFKMFADREIWKSVRIPRALLYAADERPAPPRRKPSRRTLTSEERRVLASLDGPVAATGRLECVRCHAQYTVGRYGPELSARTVRGEWKRFVCAVCNGKAVSRGN